MPKLHRTIRKSYKQENKEEKPAEVKKYIGTEGIRKDDGVGISRLNIDKEEKIGLAIILGTLEEIIILIRS